MSTTSKSPRKVAAVALAIGTRTLPTYSHRCSRKDFTQPQLFACLVLRQFFRTDYRGIVAMLDDWPALCKIIGLSKAPHFTTLQKAENRLLRDTQVHALLSASIELYHGLGPWSDGKPAQVVSVEITAADSTGFALDRASRYFIKRRNRSDKTSSNPHYQTTTYRRFGKLGIVIDCDRHLILSTHRSRGPRPDVDQLQPLLDNFCDHVIPDCMLLDAGYDSEANHERLRERLGITSWIPPTAGRPTDKLPAGKWRWLMATAFDEELYGQRWQVETVMYMIKCRQGAALRARKYQTRRREMGLMSITHNIMILYRWGGFLQGTVDLVFQKQPGVFVRWELNRRPSS